MTTSDSLILETREVNLLLDLKNMLPIGPCTHANILWRSEEGRSSVWDIQIRDTYSVKTISPSSAGRFKICG